MHDFTTFEVDLMEPTIRTTTVTRKRSARELRDAGSNGIVYRSMRHEGGVCLAALRPKAVGLPISGPNLRFHFDGERIDRWFHFGEKAWHAIGT